MHNAQKYNLAINVVDELTNHNIGRSKSATYRTADIVGLDVVLSVLKTFDMLNNEINNKNNEKFKPYYAIPKQLEYLINKKHLGQKSAAGFYKKIDGEILIWDQNTTIEMPQYIKPLQVVDKQIIEILSSNLNIIQKINLLSSIKHPQALFVLENLSMLKKYVQAYANIIAFNFDDIAKAMHHGFAWNIEDFILLCQA